MGRTYKIGWDMRRFDRLPVDELRTVLESIRRRAASKIAEEEKRLVINGLPRTLCASCEQHIYEGVPVDGFGYCLGCVALRSQAWKLARTAMEVVRVGGGIEAIEDSRDARKSRDKLRRWSKIMERQNREHALHDPDVELRYALELFAWVEKLNGIHNQMATPARVPDDAREDERRGDSGT